MSSISSIGQQGQQNTTGYDSMDISSGDFIKLLITELQNQDPLDPMDTQDMIAQISQIKAIESNDQLTETLAAVLLGQNTATGGSLIGRTIEALADDGRRIAGEVDRVSIESDVVKLHVGEDIVDLKNVTGIFSSE